MAADLAKRSHFGLMGQGFGKAAAVARRAKARWQTESQPHQKSKMRNEPIWKPPLDTKSFGRKRLREESGVEKRTHFAGPHGLQKAPANTPLLVNYRIANGPDCSGLVSL